MELPLIFTPGKVEADVGSEQDVVCSALQLDMSFHAEPNIVLTCLPFSPMLAVQAVSGGIDVDEPSPEVPSLAAVGETVAAAEFFHRLD